MDKEKKVSLQYLRRISDNYELTLEKAQEIFPQFEIVDNTIKNNNDE